MSKSNWRSHREEYHQPTPSRVNLVRFSHSHSNELNFDPSAYLSTSPVCLMVQTCQRTTHHVPKLSCHYPKTPGRSGVCTICLNGRLPNVLFILAPQQCPNELGRVGP